MTMPRLHSEFFKFNVGDRSSKKKIDKAYKQKLYKMVSRYRIH